MALSVLAVTDKVISRLAESGVENPTIYGPEIETWIPEALYRVTLKNQLDKEFEKIVSGLSITSGVLTISDTTLILSTIRNVRVGTTPAFFAPTYNDLRATAPSNDAYWFIVEGNTLVFKDTDGTLGDAANSGGTTLAAAAVPPLASLHARFEPALIEELVLMGLSAIRKEAA